VRAGRGQLLLLLVVVMMMPLLPLLLLRQGKAQARCGAPIPTAPRQ